MELEKFAMNIHQLSINYLQEHDRILVRVNTTDAAQLRLWFTRRLALGFAPLMSRVVTQHIAAQEATQSKYIFPAVMSDTTAQQMLADFKKQEHLQKSDFQTPFKNEPSQLPLGGEPLLVTEVNMTPMPSGQMQLVFSEKLADVSRPRSFTMLLEANLTHGFVHLLDKAIAVSQWRQDILVELGGDKPPAGETTDTRAKPKYWN